jgi:hypothetical protein
MRLPKSTKQYQANVRFVLSASFLLIKSKSDTHPGLIEKMNTVLKKIQEWVDEFFFDTCAASPSGSFQAQSYTAPIGDSGHQSL